ncbi:hypothetical protein SO694_00039056 [Aureococcus anophagefferens]|uniref:CSC1/OSCA1-like cytosolic domain-containing protein n=1 Tax=Aureococcus anophagefferens TaxID=44056 RepID=A0ABR1FLJ9_AURAN
MHEEQKEMDTARLPNPRDAIEQWLRGAGVPRSTASSSASLLAERNWQPAGASGALSDMRGLPDEAVLLAQRRLGRESVYREFLEGGDDPEVELFFRALRVSFWAMCAMALCYGPALAIHRAGNDGYALSTPKIVVDAVGCVDGGGGVDCACSDKGVDKVRFCDGWRYLSIWGRRYRDHRVAYALAGSALAASIVLVVAALYFDRTLGKVVARRRTIQAEPADYTIIVKGLPPTATIASLSHPFGNLIRRARKMLKVDEKAETLNALLARERSDRARPGRIARLERKIAKTRKRFEKSATKLRKRYAPERTMRPCGRVAFVTFEHEESWCARARRARRGRFALLAAPALAINKAAVAARDAVESIPDSLQCRALEAAVVGTFNSTLRELRYNETVDCGGDAYHLAYDGLDYDQLPPLELDAYGDISPLPRGDAGLDVLRDVDGGLRCEHAAARVEAVPKVCRSRGGRSDDKHAHALFPCGANATCDTLAVTCAAPRCGVCDDPCAPGDRSRDNEDDVCYTLPCYGRSESGAPGWIDDPGYSCFEYHPSLLAACFCRFNLGAKKAALILAGRRKPAEADVCAKTLRNVMVAFLLKIAVALLVVLVNELVRVALYALTDFERHSSQTTRG